MTSRREVVDAGWRKSCMQRILRIISWRRKFFHFYLHLNKSCVRERARHIDRPLSISDQKFHRYSSLKKRHLLDQRRVGVLETCDCLGMELCLCSTYLRRPISLICDSLTVVFLTWIIKFDFCSKFVESTSVDVSCRSSMFHYKRLWLQYVCFTEE